MVQEIQNYLPGSHPWQNQIHWLASTDSTNLVVRKMAQEGAPHGTVVIADHQTAGRGRLGRSFQSPKGVGIYMSILLRPHCKPTELMHLTCLTAVAVCDAIERVTSVRPGIKWINDLVYNKQKLAGILTELSVDANSGLVDFAIVGIGINCLQRAEDFADEIKDIACSLYTISGKEYFRSQLIAETISAMSQLCSDLTHPKDVMKRYAENCITLGTDICLIRGDEVRYGHALGLDETGGLIVQFRNGVIETVSSGEVSVRGMYGYQ